MPSSISLPWRYPPMIPNSTLQQRHHSARPKRRPQKKKKKNPPKVFSLLPKKQKKAGRERIPKTSFLSHPFTRPQTRISCAKDDLRLPWIDVPDVSPETGRFKRRD
ncbi:hypothetical protein CDAR_536511 [Caerostris darwini]|uniref:Uncharacterized protein n=1 Tax=Caerostris darwini TaxID=1538125 RepID=A0AAV4V0L8_9ARAC|nr:hypothetical protein CDAR_536511 [Caerostris darwini]